MARYQLVDGERSCELGSRPARSCTLKAGRTDAHIVPIAPCSKSRATAPAGWTLLLAAAVTLHTLAAPFAKVEESFNLQATHDLLFHGRNVSAYDHLEFPGVVPRTFLGAAAVAATAAPVVVPLRLMGAPKLVVQIAVRLVLVSSLGSWWGSGRCLKRCGVAPAVKRSTVLSLIDISLVTAPCSGRRLYTRREA